MTGDITMDTERALGVALLVLKRQDAHVTEAERKQAAQTVCWMLAQRGCEGYDPVITDGKLTTLCDLVMFG